jgi:hypothetical protein
MRIPLYEITNFHSHIEKVKEWLASIIEKDPALIEQYHIGVYKNNQTITILGKDIIHLNIEDHDSNQATLNPIGNQLMIKMPQAADDFEKKVISRKLLSKYLVIRYKPFVEERIRYWNDLHFKKEISSVVMRDNYSNWGSCSSKNKISISTRSLLLPMEIFDYILVHELSHLAVMNHSNKFWEVVKRVMPNYEEAEKWIRINGGVTNL